MKTLFLFLLVLITCTSRAQNHQESGKSASIQVIPDTLKIKETKDYISKAIKGYIIKFRDGHEETAISIKQSGDTVSYTKRFEEGITRYSSIQMIDTIIAIESPLPKVFSRQEIKYPPTPWLPAGDIDLSLKAATTMGALSLIFQAGGAVMIGIPGVLQTADHEDATMYGFTTFCGIFASIGGFGMGTNVPILTDRACRQLRAWECRPEEESYKKHLMKNIKTARTLSIIQNLTPLVAIISAGITSAVVKKGNATTVALLCAYGAGLCLYVPEIVLIEHARHDLNTGCPELAVGMNSAGMGLRIKF